MDFLNQFSRDTIVKFVKSYTELKCYKYATDYMKYLIKSDEPLSFEERDTFFSIYLRQKDSLYDQYQRILNDANLNDKQRLDLREETRLAVYGIFNETLGLINSIWIEKNEDPKAILDYKLYRGIMHYWKHMVSQHYQKKKDDERKMALKCFDEISQTPVEELEAAHPTRLGAATYEAYLLTTYADKRLRCEEAHNRGRQGFDLLDEELKRFAEVYLDNLSDYIEYYTVKEEDEVL